VAEASTPAGLLETGGPGSGHHTLGVTGAHDLRSAVLALVVAWVVAIVWLHLRQSRARANGVNSGDGVDGARVATAGSLLSAAAMGAMAFAA
jgi:hypothetical protein